MAPQTDTRIASAAHDEPAAATIADAYTSLTHAAEFITALAAAAQLFIDDKRPCDAYSLLALVIEQAKSVAVVADGFEFAENRK